MEKRRWQQQQQPMYFSGCKLKGYNLSAGSLGWVIMMCFLIQAVRNIIKLYSSANIANLSVLCLCLSYQLLHVLTCCLPPETNSDTLPRVGRMVEPRVHWGPVFSSLQECCLRCLWNTLYAWIYAKCFDIL